jgi:hypothetical protein
VSLRLGPEIQEVPRGRAVGRTALGLLSLILPALPARAQSPTAARAASFDSVEVLRRAQAAVRDFEAMRRANLPTDPHDNRGRCDVRIGRFCHWDVAPGSELPPEPGRIDEARASLLDQLADAARSLPGDGWIAGQRVRYLVEEGRASQALAAARDCRAETWWCSALEGLALHSQEADEGADSAFGRALALMPAGERCAWLDLSALLDEQADRYARIPCGARADVNLRIWWLARPLYSRAGNDLRVEHYARHVMARMFAAAQNAYGLGWGEDAAESIVRYGWWVHWTRSATDARGGESAQVLGYERTPNWTFFASPEVPPRWDLDRERAATRYAPTWAKRFVTIPDAQIARFRRGDSVVTIAGFDVSTDTALAGQIPRVRLAVGTDAASPVVVGPTLAAAHGGVSVRSADPPAVVSLEAVHEPSGWVGRLRTATADPTAWITSRMSDLLLVAADAGTSGPGESLTAIALPGVTLLALRPIGIYWEWYEHPPKGTVVTIEARVARLGGSGAPSPLGRSECVPADKAAIAVQWRETAGERPALGRAITLDLARLEPGRYLAAMSMQAGLDSLRCSSRELVLVGP